MADESANAAAEAVRAAIDLSVSASTTRFSISLKIDNTILAGIISVGGLALGAFYLANRRSVENALRNGLEIRNESGMVDPEIRNIEEGSILVELHCHSEHSFIQFVEDFEAKKVKHRLEEEFTKIGFQRKLCVTIRNADEVYRKVKMVRPSQKGSKTKKVEDKGFQKADEHIEGEKSRQRSERQGEQSEQPSERQGEQSEPPSETQGEQSKQLSEWEEEQSEQPSEREGEQSEPPIEQETPDVHFSLLAEVKELKKIAIELNRQQNESEELKKMLEECKQMKIQIQDLLKRKEALCQGEESTQHFERKQPDDVFSLLAEVRVLRKIVTEREKHVQQKENEELKKMLEEFKQRNIQMQHLLKGKESELSELATEREGGQLNQQRKLKGEQSEQPKERETPDDIFRSLAEVKELTKIAYEGDIQQKEKEDLKKLIAKCKQMIEALCQGKESKQPIKREKEEDMFSLLAEVRELRKITPERERQQKEKEKERVEKMKQDCEQMNTQLQHLLKMTKRK